MKWILFFSFTAVLIAQPKFEVVSIRPSNSGGGGVLGGPGTMRPELITFSGVPLSVVIMRAFDIENLRDFQISGPAWIKEAKFEIQATIPPGATRQDLSFMLRDMLEERFKLVVHHESREFPSYELRLENGDPHLPEGRAAVLIPRRLREGWEIESRGMKLDVLATALEMSVLHAAVINNTGITGAYNYTIHFSVDADATTEFSFPSLPAALKDIGLKLEKGKNTFDVIVIDQIERFPTAN